MIKKFNDFLNESVDTINWDDIENKWYNFIEENNNELEYYEEFNYLKGFIRDNDINASAVVDDYSDYIEETNNEDDSETKFKKFKSLVIKHKK